MVKVDRNGMDRQSLVQVLSKSVESVRTPFHRPEGTPGSRRSSRELPPVHGVLPDRMEPLLRMTGAGLYCPDGGFHIDPWKPVPRAVITHAHSDHARPGSEAYLTSGEGEGLVRERLGPGTRVESIPWGETRRIGSVAVRLHPAGHVRGSAQIRIERRGEVGVVSGDYKLQPDPTTRSFEPLRCDLFVSECTFGLPVYRWDPVATVVAEIRQWWEENREAGRTSLLLVYSLGKAQRILAELEGSGDPVLLHGATHRITECYRREGVRLPPTLPVASVRRGGLPAGALVLAPPSVLGSSWTRNLGAISTGVASGWMRIRGIRRRRAVDRGFVLSDHADWDGLRKAILETGASRVILTHGNGEPLRRLLRDEGVDASLLETRWSGEEEVGEEEVGEEVGDPGPDGIAG